MAFTAIVPEENKTKSMFNVLWELRLWKLIHGA